MVDLDAVVARAWNVVERCDPDGRGLRAAAGSTLYPHVWTRDVGLASLGILAAPRGPDDLHRVRRSLEVIVRHQDELGRIPLKVDVAEDRPVSENSAGVDAGLWFVLAVAALARHEDVERFVDPARRALYWTRHLDVDGDAILETPEASDWADMMPHRHHVLFVNVLFVAALRALAELTGTTEHADRATQVAARINRLFWLEGCFDAKGTADYLAALERDCPEWGVTGRYVARWGALPYYLPYVGFRAAGRHCDVVGNCLAVLFGVADDTRAASILDHLDHVGANAPYPSKTIDPPLYPGDPDYRDHFTWRGLNVPHQYQNGGAWPFIGGLEAVARVRAGRSPERVVARLVDAVEDPQHPFPEWRHGRSGAAMGERDQLWSATGVLWAIAAQRDGRVDVPGGAP